MLANFQRDKSTKRTRTQKVNNTTEYNRGRKITKERQKKLEKKIEKDRKKQARSGESEEKERHFLFTFLDSPG